MAKRKKEDSDSDSDSSSSSSSSRSSSTDSSSSSSSDSSSTDNEKKSKKKKKDKKADKKKNEDKKKIKSYKNSFVPTHVIAEIEEQQKRRREISELYRYNPLQNPIFLETIKRNYIDVPNVQRLSKALLSNFQEEYTSQGFLEKSKPILRQIIADIKAIFVSIDGECPISIENIPNSSKKKKLRHLFQALHLCKKERTEVEVANNINERLGNEGWYKSPAIQNTKVWHHVLRFFLMDAKIVLEKEWGLSSRIPGKLHVSKNKNKNTAVGPTPAEKAAIVANIKEKRLEERKLSKAKEREERQAQKQQEKTASKALKQSKRLQKKEKLVKAKMEKLGIEFEETGSNQLDNGNDLVPGGNPNANPSVGPARPPPNTIITKTPGGPNRSIVGGLTSAADYAKQTGANEAAEREALRMAQVDEYGRGAWMTQAPESLLAAFGEKVPEKEDAFAQGRTAEEIAIFEKAIKDQKAKPSLMAHVRENLSTVEIEKARKIANQRMQGDSEIWGESAKNQETILKRQAQERAQLEGTASGAHEGTEGPATKLRRMFDPSKDLEKRGGMSSKDFQKLIGGESRLKGMFGKSETSNSFL